MPIPDDERFESYLKQFRPAGALPLPIGKSARRPRFVLLARLAAAAVVLVLLGFSLRLRPLRQNSDQRGTAIASTEHLENSTPLTLAVANALLSTAPSFSFVFKEMSFRSATAPPPAGKFSALAVLSKEKTRL